MARLVLIAAAVAAGALAGCYGPSIADCAYRCATDRECPATQTCDVAVGSCRARGAVGECGGIQPGSDVDASTPEGEFVPSNYATSDLGPLDGLEIGKAFTFDTDNPTAGHVLASGAVLVHVVSFDVPADGQLSIVGSRPLIIAVEGVASVEGLVTVASTGGLCTTTTSQPAGNLCSGGGAGGTWGNRGGDGATCGDGKGQIADPPRPPALVPLATGCAGTAAADVEGAAGGRGGAGGGALEISAAGALSIRGGAQLLAPGQGGRAGAAFMGTGALAGGGGGGTGGSFLLESRVLTIGTGPALCAEGGGGGGAGFNNGATSPGQDGTTGCSPVNDGFGGSSNPLGDGVGGAGATGADPSGHHAMDTAASDAGGGGGGGGAGILVLRAHVLTNDSSGLFGPLPMLVHF